MSKIRINDLARELEVKSKEILDVLTTVGITEKKTHSSSLEDHEADLVRRHLRGRSDAAPSSTRPSSRAAHGEEEIKTKIDLSHISRPGDVLRAITQLKEAAEHPAARPAAKPPVTAPPAVEAKAEAPAAPAPPKAMPPKPAVEAPAPAGAETGDAGFGSCRVPAADSGGDSTQSSGATTRRDSTSCGPIRSEYECSTAGDRRSAASHDSDSCRASRQRSASGAATSAEQCYADASRRRPRSQRLRLRRRRE